MRKAIKWIIILGLLGGAGWVGYKWYNASSGEISSEVFNLIPADAIYCIATNDPIQSWKEIAASGAWTHLQRNAYFAELTASANSLDSLIHDNDLLFSLIGARSLIVSAHMTAYKEYDFLFLVDLKGASGIKFLNEYLTDFSTGGYSVKKEKYGEESIIIMHNRSDNSNLYISQPGSYLIASFTRKLILSSLDAHKANSSLSQDTFIKTEDDLESGGIVRLYVNYTRLPQFMRCYSATSNEYVNRLAQTLQTSNLSVTLNDELIKATGQTYLNDSVESYIKTLAVSGKGPTEFMEVAPQRTAFCLALGFNSFGEFFQNFEKNLQQDVTEYASYKENLKQVENYLKISLQENFINWIGDEVAILELQSSGEGLDNEAALILKADNIEKARKDLAYIEKMIRKRTPVKFKTVDYHGYSISYLSMKGLFKVLLGKFFARYDKPYYTIVNNFVIFSNHPQTLESIIDDYLEKNTLIKSEEFRKFRKEFDDESAAFIYLNTPVLFSTMKKLADASTQVSMDNNKDYIVCFRHIGFQLVPEEGRFKTILAEQFLDATPDIADAVEEETTEVVAEVPSEEESSKEEEAEESEEPVESDPMKLPYIYIKNPNAPSFTAVYPDSSIHFEVELKNGFKNGTFTEYHQNGEVKMTGHFKNDKRDGAWRLHDEEGKLIMRRTYEDGDIKKEKLKD